MLREKAPGRLHKSKAQNFCGKLLNNCLDELGIEYRKSLELLDQRIKILKKEKAILEAASPDPVKDPAVIEIKDRLKSLTALQNDLREVTQEVEHYYYSGWWRSERYTCNQRIGKQNRHTHMNYIDVANRGGE
jgi:hypothetical protein